MKPIVLVVAILLLVLGGGLMAEGVRRTFLTSGVILKKEVIVPANVEQVDSGFTVRKGEEIHVTASGNVNGASSSEDTAFGWVGPEGIKSPVNNGRGAPLPAGQPFMALCYRIGEGNLPVDDWRWTYAGSSKKFIADESGTLHFTVNDAIRDDKGLYLKNWRTDNQGSFTVIVSKEQR